ncbi:MAG: SDR family oxidoreductase [Tannerella sp.]|jgi:3-oxoacyl-[acyl-carrier protein] reductase|nr:SDR family oxidoreductase [Tannerella sp.]
MTEYALITGGTKGIGKSVARCAGKMGYNLLLTYAADETAARQTGAELSAECHVEVTPLQADSSDKTAIDTIARHVGKNGIQLGVVVFNAGLTCRDRFEDMKYDDWERVFFANVHFPVFLLQRLLGNIRRGGSVIFTGSLMGIIPHAASLSYGVTKASVHALVKNLVKFLSPRGIRVNAVAPGFVDTEWQKNKPADIRRNIESKIAMGRFCDPDELAGVYALLIENSYINGEIIIADGGYSYK